MSKHDDHFFNTFSVVIGILVVITIFLIVLARSIGTPLARERVAAEPSVIAQASERTAPVGRVAIAGQDNSALVMTAAAADGAAAAQALPKDAAETYETICSACHKGGLAGAPKVGDKAAWAPRIAQGKATLYEHALKGYKGKVGYMPPKGGRADLPDELVQQTVDYVVKMNQ